MFEGRPLLFLATVALALFMLSLGLGAFCSVGRALWGDSVERIRARMDSRWWADVRLGGFHGLGLAVLLANGHRGPLVGFPALVWLGLALACVWLGLPALVQRLGERVAGPLPPPLVPLVGAACLVWACAVPYLGQALLLLLLLGTYGAGLAILLERQQKPPRQDVTAPLAQAQLVPAEQAQE